MRLFEYPHTLLHQKVMTVDGVWSAIGSSNFDDRSFETNDEITLAIRDEALAQRLDAIFEKYVARASEIELERWRKRGPWHKLKDNAFYSDQRAALTRPASRSQTAVGSSLASSLRVPTKRARNNPAS